MENKQVLPHRISLFVLASKLVSSRWCNIVQLNLTSALLLANHDTYTDTGYPKLCIYGGQEQCWRGTYLHVWHPVRVFGL